MKKFWIAAFSTLWVLGVFLAAEAGSNPGSDYMGSADQNYMMGVGPSGDSYGGMNTAGFPQGECLGSDWGDEEYWDGFGTMHGQVGSQGETDQSLVPSWMVGFMQMMGGMMGGCW